MRLVLLLMLKFAQVDLLVGSFPSQSGSQSRSERADQGGAGLVSLAW